jgi:GT2 family glycosyltransferase
LNGLPSSPPQPAAFGQMGFLPAGLSANLAVRRRPFEAVGGFDEDLLQGEDIDLCWRLQLRGYRFAIAPDAIVSKRSRSEFVAAFHQGIAYGRSGVLLYRRYRADGARRDLPLALRSWASLVMTVPTLRSPELRTGWARAAGMRLGRLRWSIKMRAFFP